MMHHFPALKPLLEAVLAQRDAEHLAAYEAAMPEDGTLLDWTNTVVQVATSNLQENKNFDALEVQALADPSHPAHDYFQGQYNLRPYPLTVALAKREYPKNPEAVVEVIGVTVDGLRLRWLRSTEMPDYEADWGRVRDTLFAGFEQYRA